MDLSVNLGGGLENMEEFYGILVVECLVQLEAQKDEFYTEDSEIIHSFFSEINKSEIITPTIVEHLEEEISCFKLLESKTEGAFFNIVLKISFKERNEDLLRLTIGSLCPNFRLLSVPFQKSFMQMLYRKFFSAVIALAEIGIEELKQKIEENKAKEALKAEDENTETIINWREIEKRNGIPRNADVLRYVAGYLGRSLKWKNCPEDIVNCIIKKDQTQSQPPLKSERWINILNRGGLFHVEDWFFALVIRMKNISDSHYSQSIEKIRRQNIKDNARKEILKDRLILEEWTKIVVKDEDLKWLRHITETFLNTRGKVLVKDMLEHYQNDTKEAVKAKKALRKSIKEKSDAAISKLKEISQNIEGNKASCKSKTLFRKADKAKPLVKLSPEQKENSPQILKAKKLKCDKIIPSTKCQDRQEVPNPPRKCQDPQEVPNPPRKSQDDPINSNHILKDDIVSSQSKSDIFNSSQSSHKKSLSTKRRVNSFVSLTQVEGTFKTATRKSARISEKLSQYKITTN